MIRPTALQSRRARLLGGAALGLAMASPAAAQRGLQAVPTTANGTISYSIGLANAQGGLTDRVQIASTTGIIDWTPTDTGGTGAINILPLNNRLEFINVSGANTTYTVLNRIVPIDLTRPLAFSGTVQSRIQVPGLPALPGGAVWFYSPGGFILNGTSRFDVGSLLLTTSPVNTSGGLFGAGNSIRLDQAPVPTAQIVTNPGALITASSSFGTTQGNYLALVAPQITHGGTANVDGSIAYVAAEAATVAINAGLFDISFTTGSGAANPIVHTGTTTGPGVGTIDADNIVMAAVPKNTAITLLLGGQIGFATGATQDNGVVVLSAGFDQVRSQIEPTAVNGQANADIQIGTGNFTSRLIATATNALTASPSGNGQALNFTRAALLAGRVSAIVSADQSESISFANQGVGDDLTIRAGTGPTGGLARLSVGFDPLLPGSVTVVAGGKLRIDAGGTSDQATGTGGSAELLIAGGTTSFAAATVAADGQGALFANTGAATSGKGGSALVKVSGNGLLDTPTLLVSATGTGGSTSVDGKAGGNGTGGSATVAFDSATLNMNGLTVDARGSSGSGTIAGGNAAGGIASVSSTQSTGKMGPLTIRADADAAQSTGANGGNAAGGSASLAVAGDAPLIVDPIVTANGFAGDSGLSGGQSVSGTGGAGTGGKVEVTLTNTGLTLGALDLSARGAGGIGGTDASDQSGIGTGGTVSFAMTGGTLNVGPFEIDAGAGGGDPGGGFGGAGNGGSVTVSVAAGAAITATSTLFTANGRGGVADFGVGSAGSGTGGTVAMSIDGGSYTDLGGAMLLGALGTGGRAESGAPPTGTGGTVSLTLGSAVGTNLTANEIVLRARGRSENGGDGIGTSSAGLGVGGTATVTVGGGALSASTLRLEADGNGGTSNAGGIGGAGFGGRAEAIFAGGEVVLGSLELDARAFGGLGADGEDGGGAAGSGGSAGIGANPFAGTPGAYVDVASGSLSASGITVLADAFGGDGGRAVSSYGDPDPSGAGGAAQGGIAFFQIRDGASLGDSFVQISARAEGGRGGQIEYFSGAPRNQSAGAGGAATGGDVQVDMAGTGGQIAFQAIATATGGLGGSVTSPFLSAPDPLSKGAGGRGGDATGGAVTVSITGVVDAFSSGYAEAEGNGGIGGQAPRGGDAGFGKGGAATTIVGGQGSGRTTRVFAFALASGTGGPGGSGDLLAGGAGGDAFGGAARIEVIDGVNAQLDGPAATASAFGGSGGSGGSGATGSTGGRGGNAEAGSATFFVDRASMTLFAGEGGGSGLGPQANAFGGDGGRGGDGTNAGASGGMGGGAGFGLGGIARLDVNGGTVTIPPIPFGDGTEFRPLAGGDAGSGGQGGFGDSLGDVPIPAARGAPQSGIGGSIQILVADVLELGAVSKVDLGDALFAPTGTGTGSGVLRRNGNVTIANLGSASDALRFNSLTATTVENGSDGGGIAIASSAGRIAVAGDLVVKSASGVQLDFDGAGGLDVAGEALIESNDFIGFSHGSQPPAPAASVTANAIRMEAKTDMIVGAGARLIADNRLEIATGDDIIVETGGLLRASANPDGEVGVGTIDPLLEPAQLRLLAGGIVTDRPPGAVASIVFGGDLEASGSTVFLSAEAIQGGATTTIRGANLFARVTGAPAAGTPALDDDGALRADCAQGNACLGRIAATNLVRVGETGFVPNRLSVVGGIDAKDVLLRSRDTMTLGAAGTVDFIKASDALTIASTAGDVLINGTLAVESKSSVSLSAARDLIGPGATLRSPGDVDLFAGRDLTLAGLDAAQVRTVDPDGTVLNATGLQVGGAVKFTDLVRLTAPLTFRAGAGLDIERADVTGPIDLASSAGRVRLGAAGTGGLGLPTDITLAGESVALGDVKAAGKIVATASAGGMTIGTASAGGALSLSAPGAITFTSLAAGGDLTGDGKADVTGGDATGASVTLNAAGALTAGKLSATAGDLKALAGGAVALTDATASGGLTVAGAKITAQTLTSGGAMSLTSGGAAALGTATAGAGIGISAGGPLSFASLGAGQGVIATSGGDLSGGTITAASINLGAGGGLTASKLTATGGAIAATASKTIDIGSATASGAIALTGADIKAPLLSAGGALTIASTGSATLGTVTAGGNLAITAPGAITFASLAAGGDLTGDGKADVTGGDATGATVTLTAGGALIAGKVAATAGDLKATATKALDLASATASGGVFVSGSAIRTSELKAGTTLSASTLGDATFGTALSAGALEFAATGTLTVADARATKGGATLTGSSIAIGKVEAAGALKATATTGGITVDTLATGATVEFASKDITIGSAAQIGRTAETTAVTFTSTGGRAAVGGAETAGLYRLTDAELDRVQTKGDITVAVADTAQIRPEAFELQTPGTATLLIDSLSFSGNQLGASGTLRFVSPGAIGVIGGARFDAMGGGQTVLLQAVSDIALAGETGSLALRDMSGGLAATLRMQARQIHALSASARTAAATAPDLASFARRIDATDGLASQDGFFAAGTLDARISRAFFIQNSGGAAVPARRGFTAGAGGLRIEATGTAPASVAINGRVQTGGGFATGVEVIGLATIAGTLDPASTINGCAIADPAGCNVTPPPQQRPDDRPALDISRDLIRDEIDRGGLDEEEDAARRAEGGSSKLPQPIIEILDVPPSRYEPVIDEPVTGSGNDDLWEAPPPPGTPAGAGGN